MFIKVQHTVIKLVKSIQTTERSKLSAAFNFQSLFLFWLRTSERSERVRIFCYRAREKKLICVVQKSIFTFLRASFPCRLSSSRPTVATVFAGIIVCTRLISFEFRRIFSKHSKSFKRSHCSVSGMSLKHLERHALKQETRKIQTNQNVKTKQPVVNQNFTVSRRVIWTGNCLKTVSPFSRIIVEMKDWEADGFDDKILVSCLSPLSKARSIEERNRKEFFSKMAENLLRLNGFDYGGL